MRREGRLEEEESFFPSFLSGRTPAEGGYQVGFPEGRLHRRPVVDARVMTRVSAHKGPFLPPPPSLIAGGWESRPTAWSLTNVRPKFRDQQVCIRENADKQALKSAFPFSFSSLPFLSVFAGRTVAWPEGFSFPPLFSFDVRVRDPQHGESARALRESHLTGPLFFPPSSLSDRRDEDQ